MYVLGYEVRIVITVLGCMLHCGELYCSVMDCGVVCVSGVGM